MGNDTSSLGELRADARQLAESLDLPDPPKAGDDLHAIGSECLRALSSAGLLPSFRGIGDRPELTRQLRRTAVVAEGLAAESGALASIFLVNAVFAGFLLALLGNKEQRVSWLPKLAAGRAQFAFALTEPEAGSDAGALATRAEKADGAFVLTGEKQYATGALTADRILIAARVPAQANAIAVFMVAQGSEGLFVEAMPKLAGGVQPSCYVRLDGVQVSNDALLGGGLAIGATVQALRRTAALERVMVAASCIGTATRILEESRRFAAFRMQFGQRIAEFQSIRHRLVEMESAVRIMRLLLGEAIEALDNDSDPTVPVCTAKYVCAERLQWLAGAGMRILGGQAYMTESVMSRLYREAPLALYAGGTIEIQKNLIADSLGL